MADSIPLVSIVIPTRNCFLQLSRLLDSIRQQTFHNYEVIVIDNFSSDGTFELACKHAKAFQKGPERHLQRPYGVSHARGEFLMFIDADMELDTDLLQQCAEYWRCRNSFARSYPLVR